MPLLAALFEGYARVGRGMSSSSREGFPRHIIDRGDCRPALTSLDHGRLARASMWPLGFRYKRRPGALSLKHQTAETAAGIARVLAYGGRAAIA